MNLRAILPLWLLTSTFVSVPLGRLVAAEVDCKPIQRIELESAAYFENVRGSPAASGSGRWTSTYFLPNAAECQVKGSVQEHWASYTCTWYLDKGLANSASTDSAYEALVSSLAVCLPQASAIKRKNKPDRNQEAARLDDPYPSMPANANREIEIIKEYDGRWQISLEYTVDDEIPN